MVKARSLVPRVFRRRPRYLVRWIDTGTWRPRTTTVKADQPDLIEIAYRVAEQHYGSHRYVSRVELTHVYRDRPARHWTPRRHPHPTPEEP